MQSEAEAVAAAESCMLGAAERHMERTCGDVPQLPDICETCAHFLPLGADDQWEILRCVPEDVEHRHALSVHLRLCLGVCRKAAANPDKWMGVLFRRDNPCDEWEERE